MKLDRTSYFRVLGALTAASLFAHQSHAQPAAYPTVTDERLEHPDAGDWLMYRRTYDGSGFSPLNQITPSNIRGLTLAWPMSTPPAWRLQRNHADRQSRPDVRHDASKQHHRA